jgi:hypothetical protein
MRSRVPNREALQSSIDALGFDLKLHPEFTPFTDSGFSPCLLNGAADAGFEVSYFDAAEVDWAKDIAGTRDYCFSMTWHSSMRDCASVMIVSCALVKDFGAVVSYEGEAADSLEVLLQNTKIIIEDAESEQPKPAGPSQGEPPSKPWWRIW